MVIKRRFASMSLAFKAISSGSSSQTINSLNITPNEYDDFAESKNWNVKVKPTGKMTTTNGYPTEEVELIITFSSK